MIRPMRTGAALIGLLISLPCLAAAGCGGGDPATTAASATTAAPAAAAATGERTAEVDDDATEPIESGPRDRRQRAASRAVAGAEAAYRRYLAAINERDGAALCALLPVDALDVLRPPVERDGCAATLRASIGYADPRGYPVWESTALTGIEGSSVSRDLASARLTAAIVTEFADRDEPSVESDIAYLERTAAGWRLAKPSGAIYRAIGRPGPPPGAITPPG